MNDSVREELQTKVATSAGSGRLSAPAKISTPLPPVDSILPKPVPFVRSAVQKPAAPAAKKSTAPKPAPQRTVTADLGVKKTSPTLVGFQSKNATLPDWRLQLQNSVRQRSTGAPAPVRTDARAEQPGQKQTTSGANALKIESAPEPPAPAHANPRVANALKRIEESRKAFLDVPAQSDGAKPISAAPRTFPFNVVSRAPHSPVDSAAVQPVRTAKPRLVSSLRIEKRGLDTNKLPPLPQPANISTSLDGNEQAESIRLTTPDVADAAPHKFEIRAEQFDQLAVEVDEPVEAEGSDIEEIDDLAPFSMRFGAGLFDVILGAFATSILLSPLMLSGGTWMSFSGAVAFSAALAIVLFTYLTLTVGFTGRTFGMRLFSLEMIDAEENAYPTLHQAAVSASVYLLSMAFGGIGFIPVLFNEEKRAAHDILSGTILIREI